MNLMEESQDQYLTVLQHQAVYCRYFFLTLGCQIHLGLIKELGSIFIYIHMRVVCQYDVEWGLGGKYEVSYIIIQPLTIAMFSLFFTLVVGP